MIRVFKNLSADQSCDSTCWYVVATKSREEATAKLNLERQGYSVFLPQLSLRKRRKGKWEIITEPLFPGYLFVSLELGADDPGPIRSTVGCIGLVRLGHTYTPVPAELIAGLQSVAANDGVTPSPFSSGDTVRLASGPFAGLKAVYDMAKGVDRALILLELLGKVQRLTVEINSLQK
ncbi:transcription termination/antitermination NusG family protein [Luminiphilus sp. nBUS_07]|uniref:transcription termination/antitermination NusG family protein n=1 Tax=Luminiphilus sp. nBUS_07 TaxID=3395314 RepID=UPI003EB90B24